MNKRRKDLFLALLQYALLNIRFLGERGRANECSIEADHVHNIPEVLSGEDPDKAEYYWNVERKLYLQQADKYCSSRFERIWEEMARLDEVPDVYTIYIPVVGEEGSVLQPTNAIKIGSNMYQVLASSGYDPQKVELEFPPGTIVECAIKTNTFPEKIIAMRRVK